MIIEHAREEDAAEIFDLLACHRLPLDGLTKHLVTAIVARDHEHGQIVGSAALEIYRDGALLRSVAVRPDRQNRGLGRRLTQAALAMARDRHVPAVYLLTTTAERYFPQFGFEQTTRDAVPGTVQESEEFASACPSTAVVMVKRL